MEGRSDRRHEGRRRAERDDGGSEEDGKKEEAEGDEVKRKGRTGTLRVCEWNAGLS